MQIKDMSDKELKDAIDKVWNYYQGLIKESRIRQYKLERERINDRKNNNK